MTAKLKINATWGEHTSIDVEPWNMGGGVEVSNPYLAPTITVDLDQIDFERVVAEDIVKIDLISGGKRVTVAIDIRQACLDRFPRINMTSCGETGDVFRSVAVRPWVKASD